jgi:hypothetical protein
VPAGLSTQPWTLAPSGAVASSSSMGRSEAERASSDPKSVRVRSCPSRTTITSPADRGLETTAATTPPAAA